jgi:hypothetical protein
MVLGRVAGQGEEHLIQAGLTEREVRDRQLGAGQRPQRMRDPVRVVDPRRQPCRVRCQVHRHPERLGQQPLGVGPLLRVTQPHLQRARSDRGLELAGGALSDEVAVVDDGDPVGELVGLVQVLGGQQHRGPAGGQRPDDLPDLAAATRVQPGGRLVQEQQLGGDDDAGGDVQPPSHAPGVGLDLPPGRLGQPEGVQQLARPRPGAWPREAEEPGQQHQVLPPGQVLVDRGVLAGQGNQAAHHIGLRRDVVSEDPCRSAVWTEQRGEHPDGGGLAGPIWPKDAVHRTGGYRQVDAIDGQGLAERLDQARRLDGQS